MTQRLRVVVWLTGAWIVNEGRVEGGFAFHFFACFFIIHISFFTCKNSLCNGNFIFNSYHMATEGNIISKILQLSKWNGNQKFT